MRRPRMRTTADAHTRHQEPPRQILSLPAERPQRKQRRLGHHGIIQHLRRRIRHQATSAIRTQRSHERLRRCQVLLRRVLAALERSHNNNSRRRQQIQKRHLPRRRQPPTHTLRTIYQSPHRHLRRPGRRRLLLTAPRWRHRLEISERRRHTRLSDAYATQRTLPRRRGRSRQDHDSNHDSKTLRRSQRQKHQHTRRLSASARRQLEKHIQTIRHKKQDTVHHQRKPLQDTRRTRPIQKQRRIRPHHRR